MMRDRDLSPKVPLPGILIGMSLLALLLAFPSTVPSEEEVIDRIAAIVGDEIILLRIGLTGILQNRNPFKEAWLNPGEAFAVFIPFEIDAQDFSLVSVGEPPNLVTDR